MDFVALHISKHTIGTIRGTLQEKHRGSGTYEKPAKRSNALSGLNFVGAVELLLRTLTT